MLSKQQVKSLLTAAASDRLYKLDRVAAVERAEGITPDDGAAGTSSPAGRCD